MSTHCHYVTQSGVYDQLLIGKPLTNRTIKKYAAKGYYGPVAKEERKEKRMTKKDKGKALKKFLEGIK